MKNDGLPRALLITGALLAVIGTAATIFLEETERREVVSAAEVSGHVRLMVDAVDRLAARGTHDGESFAGNRNAASDGVGSLARGTGLPVSSPRTLTAISLQELIDTHRDDMDIIARFEESARSDKALFDEAVKVGNNLVAAGDSVGGLMRSRSDEGVTFYNSIPVLSREVATAIRGVASSSSPSQVMSQRQRLKEVGQALAVEESKLARYIAQSGRVQGSTISQLLSDYSQLVKRAVGAVKQLDDFLVRRAGAMQAAGNIQGDRRQMRSLSTAIVSAKSSPLSLAGFGAIAIGVIIALVASLQLGSAARKQRVSYSENLKTLKEEANQIAAAIHGLSEGGDYAELPESGVLGQLRKALNEFAGKFEPLTKELKYLLTDYAVLRAQSKGVSQSLAEHRLTRKNAVDGVGDATSKLTPLVDRVVGLLSEGGNATTSLGDLITEGGKANGSMMEQLQEGRGALTRVRSNVAGLGERCGEFDSLVVRGSERVSGMRALSGNLKLLTNRLSPEDASLLNRQADELDQLAGAIDRDVQNSRGTALSISEAVAALVKDVDNVELRVANTMEKGGALRSTLADAVQRASKLHAASNSGHEATTELRSQFSVVEKRVEALTNSAATGDANSAENERAIEGLSEITARVGDLMAQLGHRTESPAPAAEETQGAEAA